MELNQVCALYFSATGTTEAVVTTIAETIANVLGIPWARFNITLPKGRAKPLAFCKGDLVVVGMPTVAGRVPNLMLKFLATLSGKGAIAVPISLFGNRNFDDALIELCDRVNHVGMRIVAAGAFVGEHSFSRVLAAGRPDAVDMQEIIAFATRVAQGEWGDDIQVEGTPYPYRGYYQPRDRHGNDIDIRKVKPQTNADCNRCGLCARLCPLGSISAENPTEIPGICMKCCACIKGCPAGAKFYTDEGYLYHKQELEEQYARRAQNRVFF